MQHKTTHDPAFSMLQVDLQPGEILVAEAGSMAAMSRHIQMEAKLTTSPAAGTGDKAKAFFAAVVRRFLGGESFFVSHFSTQTPGSVWIAPTVSGSIVHKQLTGTNEITLSAGAYVASTGNIDVKVKYGGIKGILAKEGLFFLNIKGQGDVWFNSFGGVDIIEVNGSYVVDNGHIVGWEGNLDYEMKSAGGGLMGLVASGEGMVCEFQGQGKVYLQSRNLGSIIDWLIPIMPV